MAEQTVGQEQDTEAFEEWFHAWVQRQYPLYADEVASALREDCHAAWAAGVERGLEERDA